MARDRKRYAQKAGLPAMALPPGARSSSATPPPNDPIATPQSAPHACLVQLVRLLARQAALADIADQRAKAED